MWTSRLEKYLRLKRGFCLTAAFLLLSVLSSQSLANRELKIAEWDEHKPLRILVLGDSISAAYYIPQESGWVNLMRQRFSKLNWPVKVINASISGATSAAGLQTLPPLLKQERPHMVVLELGGNDGLQGKPVSLISKNLRSLIEQSKSAGAEVLLLGMRLPPNLGARYTEPFHLQYSQLANNYQLQLVPFLLEGVAQNPELMQADGIHPTAEAQIKLLDNVWPTIAGAVKAKLALP